MKTDVNMDAYSGVVFLDSIVTSNCFQAVFYGTKTDAFTSFGRYLPVPVVLQLDGKFSRNLIQMNMNEIGMCMFENVAYGFLHDAVDFITDAFRNMRPFSL